MTDQKPVRLAKLQPRRVLVLALVSAALALAITLWLSNAGPPVASECPVQAGAAATIDAAALGALAALNGTGQGRGYSTMAFQDAVGAPLTVASFEGKKLLINFWASWCVPCREEMPALDALAEKYNSDAFMVLPVNLDIGEGGLAKAQKFLDEGNWPNLPLYADPSFKAFERLKTEAVAIGLPATLLVDEKGCELAVLQGPAAWDSPDGHKVIEALLGV
ncbi:MAG: TlpA disulfide reductase family protein [Devosia sp.]